MTTPRRNTPERLAQARVQSVAYYENNRDRVLQRQRAWRLANQELYKERQQKYRQQHMEKHKDRYKNSRKVYYEKTKEQSLAKSRRYYAKNKERINANKKNTYQNKKQLNPPNKAPRIAEDNNAIAAESPVHVMNSELYCEQFETPLYEELSRRFVADWTPEFLLYMIEKTNEYTNMRIQKLMNNLA